LANDPNRTESSRLCYIERILVVDDHATWRNRVAEVAKRLEPGIEVETASDVESAVKKLSNDKPTLAIVDLELPHTYGEVPDPVGGLRLVQVIKKKRPRKGQEGQKEEIAQYPHRFLILTASGNYEEAVRESLRLNISAARFMIKAPEVWSGDLPTQIRLALQPPLKTCPKIDVFPRTGRVARLDGVEIILERQAWCFLSALATRPRRFVSSEELARMLCREPYCLDPKSKSYATREFSEEQMLMKQFKDYESELGLALDRAYRLVHGMPPADPIVERCEDESVFYRLNATVTQMKHDAYSMLEENVKVLIVEDDSRWRESIAKELKACGFQVVLASHVEEACSMVVRENPDLISLDLELPADQTALETGSTDISNTLRLFRFVRDHAPDLPVAVMTASEWTDEIMFPLLREGVRIEDYIKKGEAGALRRLAASLHRLWREMTSKSRILDSEANFTKLPLHRIRIDPLTKILSHVDDCAIEVRADRAKVLKILSETPNSFVSRMELIQELYPASEWDDKNLDQSLNNTVSRLRKDIKAQTGIEGSEIVVDEMKAYMLRGQPIQNI
jgi:DNA-binding response OmpR family regulator